MTLADLTALLSRVSKENPKLMDSREVALFIQACIEKQRRDDGIRAEALPRIAPVDFDVN
jgi:hypothetical protein